MTPRQRLRLFATACLLAFSILWSGQGQAGELRSYGETIRSLGMGGVRIASGEEASVIFWNPAALRYSQGLRLDLFDFGVGTNGLQNYQDFQNIGTIDGLESLSPLYGKPITVGLNTYAAMSLPNIGFGVYNEGFTDLMVNNPSLPELNVKFFNDYGYSLGGAYGWGGFSMGLALKRITRMGGSQSIGADQLDGFDTSGITSMFNDVGVGYGMDLGMMYRAPTLFNPTISLAWQNVGHTQFQLSRGLRAPDGIRDNVTASASINGDAGLVGMAAGIEYRHIGTPGEQLGKKIHMGAEVSLLNIDLRAGFYQGYTSYGLGLDLFLFQVDAALYSVERGAYPGQTPDQRVNVGISTTLGFDPNFNLISFGGKGRKVKQRR
jgi:hypothetical protein